MNRNFQ